jgi:hypothetical protein
MSRLLQACERRQWQLTDLAADPPANRSALDRVNRAWC